MAAKTPSNSPVATTTAPETKGAPDLVRLYNKVERSFVHEVTDEEGKVKKHILHAGAFATVPKEIAALWLRMFPGQVVDAGEAVASINGSRAELAAAQKRIAELEAQLAEAQKPKSADSVV